MVGIGVLLYLLKTRDKSIALYLVIKCCDWIGGEALSYPDSETTSRMRMYS